MAEPENTANNPPPEALALTVVEEKPATKEEIPDNPPPAEPKKEIMPVVKSLNSKKIVLPIALLTFLLSIPILFLGIWLLYIQQYDCEGLLKNLPRVQIGVGIGMLIIFFLSNAVIYTRAKFPVPGLIVIVALMILTLVVGLGILGEFKMESRRIVASPKWLELKVHDNDKWNDIKSCIYETRTCNDLIFRSYMLDTNGISTSNLSPVESGCCIPPSVCEMEFVNATYWRRGNKVIEGTIPYDSDCDLWQNDETMLCYDCDACKDGYVRTLERKWLKLGTFLSVMSLLLMIAHLFLFVATMWEHAG
ncbi:tetraspanin-15-like [Olea europaea subsp. europaea]|uniref:Tetraspanin-15-like n=1 Tax=Olea europaea subsp. europaea TaxID=158383 RepID=A0A8S0SVI4_OLEEU|nr:tetraspanin-15-like [Olea europaea subsp. europaea]